MGEEPNEITASMHGRIADLESEISRLEKLAESREELNMLARKLKDREEATDLFEKNTGRSNAPEKVVEEIVLKQK